MDAGKEPTDQDAAHAGVSAPDEALVREIVRAIAPAERGRLLTQLYLDVVAATAARPRG